MTETVEALRLTVIVDESDQWHHRPLYAELVHRAHAAGLAGATVLRGVEGYGATARIHTTRLVSLSSDLPVVVMVVDTEDRIRAFLPTVRAMTSGGLVIVEPVAIVPPGPEPEEPPPPAQGGGRGP